MAESGVYHDFTLTKHKKLNLDRRPCVEEETCDFTVCIKEKLSEKLDVDFPGISGVTRTGSLAKRIKTSGNLKRSIVHLSMKMLTA